MLMSINNTAIENINKPVQGTISLTSGEIRAAITNYVKEKHGITIDPLSITFNMEQEHDDAPTFEGISAPVKIKITDIK